jgi:hypothetical protein
MFCQLFGTGLGKDHRDKENTIWIPNKCFITFILEVLLVSKPKALKADLKIWNEEEVLAMWTPIKSQEVLLHRLFSNHFPILLDCSGFQGGKKSF